MTTVRQLSEKRIQQARLVRPEKENQYYLMEDGTGRDSLRGFGIRVSRRRKVFVLRYRGKPYKLGEFPALSVAEARERAFQLKSELLAAEAVLSGQRRLAPTPQAPRSPRTPQKTVAELQERFLSVKIEPERKPRTVEEYRRNWVNHLLPRFGKLHLDEVTPEMVEDMKLEMADRKVAFNRALQQLQAAFNYAVKIRWMPDNPTLAVSFYPEKPRRRRITPEEYRKLGEALVEAERSQLVSPSSLAVLWTVLLTGCRPFEIRDARLEWATLDGPSPKIRWPEGQAKGDRPGHERGRTIWLPPVLAGRLRRLPRSPDNPYLVPGTMPGQPLKDISKAWRLILRLAEIKGLTLTDARRSFRSEAPRAGIARENVAELLGHAPGSAVTDRVYLELEDREQREAAATMGAHLQELLGCDRAELESSAEGVPLVRG